MSAGRLSSADRALAKQNADLQYDRLCRDLLEFSSGALGAPALAPPAAWYLVPQNLPPLSTPLGDIAVHTHPERLPVMGVLLPPDADAACLAALGVLLSEHHAHPFFRPVFLALGYDLLPLLGRYGFAYHVVTKDAEEAAYDYLASRYRMLAVRKLIGADPVWAAPQS
ncbi:MAG: hypothetical protein AAGK37_02200 [Pseudomonadota bacterium]